MENQNSTALLVMDIQVMILQNLSDSSAILANVRKAIDKAHKNKIRVIYVRVGFRAGTPEISDFNKMFAASKSKYSNIDPEKFLEIHPDVIPQEEEIIVTKRRVSAFAGSDLDVVLRAQGIRNLVLTGCSTSGVVLSTLREAADKDFRLNVLSDCCADGDEEVHRVLTEKVFVRQAEVLLVEEW